MHHFESMPSLHISPVNDSFPTSPPASPLSFTSTPSIAGKRSRHTHRRSLAISSHLTFPAPTALDQNPALITPPLSSPALSFPKTASLESLRSGTTILDYDSDMPKTPTIDGESLCAVPSMDPLPPAPPVPPAPSEPTGDIILPDAEPDVPSTTTCEVVPSSPEVDLPVKLRKVAFNDAIIYYPPRPVSSRQASFSSQLSQPSSRETTPSSSIPSPGLCHRRSLSSFLLPSPSFLPSSTANSPIRRHTRERKSWAGLITSPFSRRRSPNRYRPPTPPLSHDPLTSQDDDDDGNTIVDDDRIDPWQPPTPIIDLDAALGPFQTPSSPSSSHPYTPSAKFWALTSHVGSTHRRSESAPEIRGLGFDAVFPSFSASADDVHDVTSTVDSRPSSSRGLKRKMSVIDEEDRQQSSSSSGRPEETEMEIDSELTRIMLQEGAEMGEMGDLVVVDNSNSVSSSGDSTLSSKRRSWRKSLREWWKKV